MRILVGMMPMEVTPHLAMPVRVSRTELASNALQGARHAVLTTLYSRAHRIGLDGASCLLDDLRKSSSFNFFVVVVICVSLRPVLEVAILVEQKLQGFGDHVGRRGVDKFSIELKLSLYRFLDSGLDGDCLWLFWRCFQNRQRSSPFLFLQDVRHLV